MLSPPPPAPPPRWSREVRERLPCFCAPAGDPDGQCDNCAAWEAEQDFIALNEAHAKHGCGFFDCVNNPGCDPGDPNCPAIRADLMTPR